MEQSIETAHKGAKGKVANPSRLAEEWDLVGTLLNILELVNDHDGSHSPRLLTPGKPQVDLSRASIYA